MRLLRVKHLGSALATAECQPSAGPVAGSAAGYGGDDAEGLALGHGGVESLEEPHVVVGHEDVDEAPDAAIGVEDPPGEAGVGGLERGQQDRKSVREGKSVAVRVDLGGRRIITKTKTTTKE